jgi:acetyl-CoA carboxylase beta subunit
MFYCALCEEVYTMYSVCADCRKIRHYMNIYSKKRIMEILDNILSREEEKQQNKIKNEIKKDIDNKKIKLEK